MPGLYPARDRAGMSAWGTLSSPLVGKVPPLAAASDCKSEMSASICLVVVGAIAIVGEFSPPCAVWLWACGVGGGAPPGAGGGAPGGGGGSQSRRVPAEPDSHW